VLATGGCRGSFGVNICKKMQNTAQEREEKSVRNSPVSTKTREGREGRDAPAVEQGPPAALRETMMEQMNLPKGLQQLKSPHWKMGKSVREK